MVHRLIDGGDQRLDDGPALSNTFSVGAAQQGRMVVIGFSTWDPGGHFGTLSSVTVGGNAATLLVNADTAVNEYNRVYYYQPAAGFAGNKAITVTFTTAFVGEMYAATYLGVDLDNPFTTASASASAGTTASVSIATARRPDLNFGQLAVKHGASVALRTALSPLTTQIADDDIAFDPANNFSYTAGRTGDGGTPFTLGYTLSLTRAWSMIGVTVNHRQWGTPRGVFYGRR